MFGKEFHAKLITGFFLVAVILVLVAGIVQGFCNIFSLDCSVAMNVLVDTLERLTDGFEINF